MAIEEQSPPKIGLALSGGGFRASIFHLGVIRRLEELGIMKQVSVVSSVSGGSIVAAYYIIEMERRLRERRSEIEEAPDTLDAVRVEMFEEIAADFFTSLDHNLRTRALIFAPFYHPIKFVKSLTPKHSRSDLIQAEYDTWFYHENTLDQLPAVAGDDNQEGLPVTFGPKLVLNTTSLMTGERVGYSRVPISGLNETKSVNKNVLPLSMIVGASACVPGLFPPVSVSGDLQIDGGVSDNQGIEGLLENDCEILLISDASGQMEQVHEQSEKIMAVIGRTMSILQFQVRNKLVDLFQIWKKEKTQRRFAFIHTFLSLKDRPGTPRVPSEFIPAIARIRTDLDQFSFVEREALMYHGYTLIDSQIEKHCPELYEQSARSEQKYPPLFKPEENVDNSEEEHALLKKRDRIKDVLETGSTGMFLHRSVQNYPVKASSVLLLTWVIPLVLLYYLEVRAHLDSLTKYVGAPFLEWVDSLVPGWISTVFSDGLLNFLKWPVTEAGVTVVLSIVILGYLLLFVTYNVMRALVRGWNLSKYEEMTGGETPSTRW